MNGYELCRDLDRAPVLAGRSSEGEFNGSILGDTRMKVRNDRNAGLCITGPHTSALSRNESIGIAVSAKTSSMVSLSDALSLNMILDACRSLMTCSATSSQVGLSERAEEQESIAGHRK